MPRWPLGVFTSVDAGLGVSFDVLSRLGIPTVHLHAPTATARTQAAANTIHANLQQLGIKVTCVFAGFEGESYADIPTVEKTVGLVPQDTRSERLIELKQIADFAAWLEVPAVGLHLGCVPHERTDADYPRLRDVTRGICDYCFKQAPGGAPGNRPRTPGRVEEVPRRRRSSQSLRQFDPANMILYGCGEPLPALRQLGRYVRSVHCKDAKWSDNLARPGAPKYP